MKRSQSLSVLVSLAIVLTLLAFIPSSVSAFSGSGSGTKADPYIITNVNQLQEMKDNLTAYYTLGNNIDASDTKNWNSGGGFVSVWGFGSTYFTGTLNGKGHTISNLYENWGDNQYVGLFGIMNGTVENVGLVSENITGKSYVGGICGYDTGNVNNDYTTGLITGVNNTGAQEIGGLVGYTPTAYIDNCYSAATINASGTDVGGLIGYFNPDGSAGRVDNSYTTGNVNGKADVGGLIGYVTGNLTIDIVSQCYATGNVTGTGNAIGGLIGTSSCKIINCYATGTVTGAGSIGGLTGNTTATIINCYSAGSVSGSDGYVGGLSGQGGTSTSSFWDTQTSGLSGSACGTGKTTDNMKNIKTYTDNTWSDGLTIPWDMVLIGDYVNQTWYIDNGNDYPRLGWQITNIHSVSVSISPSSQSGADNATLNYTVTVTNTGNVSDNYILTDNDNAGWSPSLSKTSIVVGAGSSDNTTTLSVTIPSSAVGGTIDNLKVTATGTGDNASSTCTAQVTTTREVTVSISPTSQSGADNVIENYNVTVSNSGNVQENFQLGKGDNSGWTLSLDNTFLLVPAGDNGTTTLRVTIGSTIDNTVDNAWVEAVSQDNASISDNKSCLAKVSSVITHPPTCAITAPPDGYSTTTGVSVAFACTASSPDNSPLTYFWQFGDSGTSAQQLPSHTYSSAGDYSVSLTVTDNVGLTGSDSITIHITTPGGGTGGTGGGTTYYTLTISVTGNGTTTPSGATSQSSGITVTITATPDNGWFFDHWTGDLSGSQNPATVTMNANKTVGAYFVQIPPSENQPWNQPVQTPLGTFPLWQIIVAGIVALAVVVGAIAIEVRKPPSSKPRVME